MPRSVPAVLTALSTVFPCIRNPDFSLSLLLYSLKVPPAHTFNQKIRRNHEG